MIKQIYINLPVEDLARSIAFFRAVGFAEVPQFCGEGAGCFSVNESIVLMLLPQEKFRELTPKAVCDTSQAVEVLLTMSCESRQQVDDLVARALANGGTTYEQAEDYGFMYTHHFVDPDGHGWGLVYMATEPAQG